MAFEEEVKWLVQSCWPESSNTVVRRWLRHVENLRDTEEVVHICEPKVGKTLSDEEGRSVKGLINCQEGRDEFSNF
jgi:hypothetical protein